MNYKKLVRFIMISTSAIVTIDFLYGAFYYQFMIINDIKSVQIAFLMSLSSIVLMIFDFPYGNISDIIGRKKTAALGRLIWGLGLITFSLSTQYYSFLISAIIINLGVALNSESISSWLSDYLILRKKEDMWSSIISRTMYMTNFSKFFINAIILFVYFISDINVIFISGIGMILASIFTFFSFKGEDNYGVHHKNLVKSIFANFRYVINVPAMRKIVGIEMLSALTLPTLLLLFPIKFLNGFNYSESYLPYIYLALTLFMFIGSIIYRKLLVRITVESLYLYNLIFSGFAITFFIFSSNYITFFISLLFYEIAIVINLSSKGTWKYKYFESHNKASMASAVSALGSLASSILFLVVGYLLTVNELGLILLATINIMFITVTIIIFKSMHIQSII